MRVAKELKFQTPRSICKRRDPYADEREHTKIVFDRRVDGHIEGTLIKTDKNNE